MTGLQALFLNFNTLLIFGKKYLRIKNITNYMVSFYEYIVSLLCFFVIFFYINLTNFNTSY